MAIIRPCADLRNNYNEISRICHETQKPVFITKNGRNDLVLLTNDAYEKYESYEEQLAEERVNKKLEEEFNKKYPDFESFNKDLEEKIDRALKSVEEGRYRPIEELIKEFEEEDNIWLNTK